MSPASRVAFEVLQEADTLAVWLSGSGPTVAAFADPDQAERVARRLPVDGTAKVLSIDNAGARLL